MNPVWWDPLAVSEQVSRGRHHCHSKPCALRIIPSCIEQGSIDVPLGIEWDVVTRAAVPFEGVASLRGRDESTHSQKPSGKEYPPSVRFKLINKLLDPGWSAGPASMWLGRWAAVAMLQGTRVTEAQLTPGIFCPRSH